MIIFYLHKYLDLDLTAQKVRIANAAKLTNNFATH